MDTWREVLLDVDIALMDIKHWKLGSIYNGADNL
jgi:hypothetical protein